jgi:type VI secretion system protein ImpE
MSMSAREFFHAGSLDRAIDAASSAVKARPDDSSSRGLLSELLCFAGDFERADTHLDVLGDRHPDLAVGLALFRQLLRAERARRDFFDHGRIPALLEAPAGDTRLRLEASVHIRGGAAPDAARLLAAAESARRHPRGTCNGRPFDDLRDLDDLTASVFEVLTGTGKYYWIPLERVELVEFHPPQRPRDLLWRRCRMVVRDGPDGEVFVPAIYPPAAARSAPDDRARLGRMTSWSGADDGPVRGVGLRTFLVGDEARSIMELGTLEMAG